MSADAELTGVPTSVSLLDRRGFCAAIAIAAMSSACAGPGPSAPGRASSASPPPSGKLVIARDGKFSLFDVSTRQQTVFASFSKDAFASSPAVSPDRKQLAYTYYVVPTDKNDLGGNDLYVMDVNGTNPHAIRTHVAGGGSFEEPAWSSDASALFATLRAPLVVAGQTVGETASIVRVPLNGGETTPVASGESPAASADGKLLAYLTTDRQSQTHLWVSNVDGGNARERLGGQHFTNFRAPRFSPDSQTIVVAGEGGPANPRAERRQTSHPLLAFLAPGVAEADGIPMTVWTMKVDGTNLRPITHALDHSPVPAWSPDGKWIAVAGELYLTLVDAGGSQTIQLMKDARLSGISWWK